MAETIRRGGSGSRIPKQSGTEPETLATDKPMLLDKVVASADKASPPPVPEKPAVVIEKAMLVESPKPLADKPADKGGSNKPMSDKVHSSKHTVEKVLPAARPMPAAAPFVAAATQISGSGTASRAMPFDPGALHEDATGLLYAGDLQSTHRNIPAQTLRSERSMPIIEDERPKVWIATHKAPPDPDPRLILVREPDSARAASFRVMRHRISERGDPRVIAVTSPGPRDGKTTCAANLALALSEFGRSKVLLLEANLRSPQIAVLFGFLPPECFSVQLQRHRERPLDPWSIVEAFSPALHVLAVKPGETNRPLLDAPAFGIAIDMLKRVGYDHIVVDTPPVLGSADVNLIEDYVDAVVLTARSGRTFGRSLRTAIEQLSPRRLLGVTLLDV